MSLKTATIAVAILASFAAASAANALTIVNKDDHNHNVRFIVTGAKPTDKPVEVKIDKGKSAEFDCSKGCVAHLGKHDDAKKDVTLKGTEKTLTIEKDKLTAS